MGADREGDKGGRLLSLDVFRGLDMWIITGGSFFLANLSELVTGTKGSWLAVQMTHVKWSGLHIYDLVFPFFLFIAGVAWPFSQAKRLAGGTTRRQMVAHIVRRVLALVVLGLVCWKIQFCDWANFRFWSVLGRVGLAWGMAALLFTFFRPKTCLWILLGLFAAWWAILLFVPNPFRLEEMTAAGLTPMSQWRYSVFAWVWRYTSFSSKDGSGFDTIGMVQLVMAGVFAGRWLMRTDVSGNRRAALMAAAGAVAIAAGLVFAFGFGRLSMPIDKNAYSTSYVLVTGGLALLILAVLHWIVDVRGCVRWSLYFRVIGANALAIYVAGYILPFKEIARFFLGILPTLSSAPGYELTVVAVGALAVRWAILHFLYRHKIFFKV